MNKANDNGVTALYIASENGHIEVVKTLVEAHANLHNVDNLGNTSLSVAQYHSHTQIVKYLENEIKWQHKNISCVPMKIIKRIKHIDLHS